MKLLRMAMMAVALVAAAFDAPRLAAQTAPETPEDAAQRKKLEQKEAAMRSNWIRPDDGPHQKTVEELIGAIRAELPAGWTVKYDKELAMLEVTLTQQILFDDSAIPNVGTTASNPLGGFWFTFRVVSFVSFQEYQRLGEENVKIERERRALYEYLMKQGLQVKFDNFRPKNDEDRKVIAEYRALKESVHRPPNYYFRDISLDWESHAPDAQFEAVPSDPKVKSECDRIQVKLAKLLQKYDVPASGSYPAQPNQ